jgi:hypothetical protein
MKQDDRPTSSGENFPHEVTGDEDTRLLSAQLRAALRKDLAPDAQHRARIRAGVWSAVATGHLPASASRVDAAMKARVLGLKGGVGALGHALGTKLIVSGLVLSAAAGGTTLATRQLSGRQATPSAHVSAPAARDLEAQPPAARAEEPSAVEPTAALETECEQQAPEPVATVGSALATGASESRRATVPRAAQRLFAESIGASASRSQPPTRGAEGRGFATPASAAQQAPPPVAQNAGASQPTAAATSTTAAQPTTVVTPAAAATQPEQTVAATAAPTAQPAEVAVAPVLTQPVAAQLQTGPVVAPPARPAASLAAELALVRAASVAVDHAEPTRTLALLSRYEAQYPHGALRTEVEALRAVALCRSSKPGAAPVSAAFLREHGSSTLAERVQRACTGSK